MNPSKFEDSLAKLDLKGIILMQGLLAQQALKLLYEEEHKASPVLVPEKKLIQL